ncbi:hypothetical protein Glove_478g74 [Diversispora epigaea]|uniref:BTB domain-containing protein n=1 Tax=Diversispora epigaea TaxID=1348612 RepID=A0A397GPM5_9GLOM|nr:hypothetical protein Glove_478g74 [Diversispora epigaea]
MSMLTSRSQFTSNLNNFIINNQKFTFINKSLLFRSSNNNNIYKNVIIKPIISSTFNRGLVTESCSSCADVVPAASAAPEKLPVVIPKLNLAEKGALIEKMKSYYEENYVDSFNKELLKDVKNYVQKKSSLYLNCLFYDSLSNDFTQLLEDPIDYNVKIEIGETPSTNIYKVHSIDLQSRSPFFKKKFDEITFNDYHVKVLKLPNISVKVFDVIIKYIYGGKISLEKLENSTIFDLVIASNELELDELVEHLQIYLVNNCDSWLRLEFARIYQQSQVINLEIIQDFYNEIIAKYPKTVFESENFHSVTEDSLISILKQDDLQLEESKIWEYVIEWGKAKNPSLPTNLDQWTSDNFLTLKETLKGCLPHIRYFSFSKEDAVEKIYPYQQLLELQLFSDINVKLITPSKPISSIVLPPRRILNTTLLTRTAPIPLPSKTITDEPKTINDEPKTPTDTGDFTIYGHIIILAVATPIKIWEYVIEWGKAKNPSLPTNLDQWTSDNFLTLKETLKGCLPHIRYFSFSKEDAVEKIYPYQQLLELQLFSDINVKLITPSKPISSIVLPPRRILNTTLLTRTAPIPLPSKTITDEPKTINDEPKTPTDTGDFTIYGHIIILAVATPMYLSFCISELLNYFRH